MVACPPRRPPLSTALSGAELLRWYWLKSELVVLARQLGVSSAGGKAELTARLVAVLEGQPLPAAARRQRGAGARLTGPLSRDTLIPVGQRSDQGLRAWFVEQIGPGFRFDGPMRTFIADGGRTLEMLAAWAGHRALPVEERRPDIPAG